MKNMYELFDEFSKAQTDIDRINVLRKDNREILRQLLQGAFHPAVQFVFDEPLLYTPSQSPPGLGYTSIEQEFKRIYIFVKGSTKADPNLSLDRRATILVQMLEAMEKREAEVFMNMILKDLKIPHLTYELVSVAFPGLLP